MADKISEIVQKKGYKDINLVTHSVGSYVAQYAVDKENFPKDILRNVINLASPMQDAPQKLTYDLSYSLEQFKEMTLPENVAYFHFDGGVRDFFVGSSLAKKTELPTNEVVIQTETMKNINSSFDHNS